MEDVFFSTVEPGCIFSSVEIYGLVVQLLKLKAAKSTLSSNEKCIAKCNKYLIFWKSCSGGAEAVHVHT